MKEPVPLIDLDPLWILNKTGHRMGFVFRSPINRRFWQSCFVQPTKTYYQWELLEATVPPEDIYRFQACDPFSSWKIEGGIDSASFSTLTVRPSLDGSKGGLWHGHITNGILS